MSAPAPSPLPRRPSDGKDADRARVGRLLVGQSLLLLAMVYAFTVPLPFKLLSAVLALAAFGLGVVLWRVTRRGAGWTTARASASAGMALGLVGLTVALLPLLAWDETARYEDCTASALTDRARQVCTEQFRHDVESRAGLPTAG